MSQVRTEAGTAEEFCDNKLETKSWALGGWGREKDRREIPEFIVLLGVWF